MCPLRRVEDDRAGPSALGILVPPGRRTFLIVPLGRCGINAYSPQSTSRWRFNRGHDEPEYSHGLGGGARREFDLSGLMRVC
jgi:hypothetical protein